ncbi:general substrate transporter [Staphylotrichum tortipilum]|uniref:General substrate transporter n=1 Tax=Staphylotrichum tortipilum TaxID=2831512 RepID=A0AAN6MBR5_9PEZI|nr:general substrate transporter [Staphylotrichum longicolle]
MNRQEHHFAVEAEPLLPATDNDTGDLQEDSINSIPEHEAHKPHSRRGLAARFQAQRRTSIVALLAILMFAITMSGMLILIPIFRLVEDAICHVHYGKPLAEPIEERLCKVEDVQKELALLGGVSAMLNSVVGLVAALPYGVLADRIGRKPSFILAYVGIVLAFAWGPLMLVIGPMPNVRLSVLGSLFFLIGGGIPVAMNSLHAMASDISSEADRATSFLFLSFGAVSGGLAGPVTAGLLMEHLGPWFPVLLVFCLTPFVFSLTIFLPETLPIKLRSAAATSPQPDQPTLTTKLRDAAGELRVSLLLLKNRNIALSLPAFAIQPALFVAYSSTLAQHISTYFGWTLAQTNYLLSPLGVLQLVIIVLLPRAGGVLTDPAGRFGLSGFAKDLALTKVSFLLLVAGAVVEGCSRGVVVFMVGLVVGTVGSSSGPLCRAIATGYVEPRQTSRLYALISLAETGGAVLGGPVLAWCFSVGMEKRGVWIGLPWFYVAGLVVVALVSLMFLRAPKEKAGEEGAGSEGGGEVGYQSAEESV